MTGVFRTNLAFQKYNEGRCLLGKMVDSLTSAVRLASSLEAFQNDSSSSSSSESKGRDDDDDNNNDVIIPDSNPMRQLVHHANVVAAMIRVDLRESRLPFGASKGVKNTKWKDKFNPKLHLKNGLSVVKSSVVTVAQATGNVLGVQLMKDDKEDTVRHFLTNDFRYSLILFNSTFDT